MKKKKRDEKLGKKKPKGIPIPAGTEQETGLTRGKTEKGPIKKDKIRIETSE